MCRSTFPRELGWSCSSNGTWSALGSVLEHFWFRWARLAVEYGESEGPLGGEF